MWAAMAAAYVVLMAGSFVLKPSVATNGAFWPPFAIGFLAYHWLALRWWGVVFLLATTIDLLVIPTVSHGATGVWPAPGYALLISLSSSLVCAGMAAMMAAVRRLERGQRDAAAAQPLRVLFLTVGAVPGVLLTAWLHARAAHTVIAALDVLSRLIACVLSVVACGPLVTGLTRGFREATPARTGSAERMGLLLTWAFLSVGMTQVRWPLSDRFTELLLLLIPLFWLALRASRAAVACAVAVLATGVALAAAHGIGAFPAMAGAGGWADGILSTQLFLLVACGEALLINRTVCERDALLATYDRQQSELRDYAEALDRADEAARRSAAADLHDGVGQILAGQGMILGAMKKHADERGPLRSMLDQAHAAAQEAQTTIRHAIQDLSPPELEDVSLGEILAFTTRMFETRYGFKVHCSVAGTADESRLPLRLLYRIVRELVQNACRHSRRSEARLAIRLTADAISLRVADSGVGFDGRSEPAAPGSPFGLANLRERIRATGGSLTVDSTPGGGCRVSVVLPLLPGLANAPSGMIASEPA